MNKKKLAAIGVSVGAGALAFSYLPFPVPDTKNLLHQPEPAVYKVHRFESDSARFFADCDLDGKIDQTTLVRGTRHVAENFVKEGYARCIWTSSEYETMTPGIEEFANQALWNLQNMMLYQTPGGKESKF